MEWLHWLIDIVLHLDRHLAELLEHFGLWTYGILFLIVFAETGLVVTPFLPGDSLLFAAGALTVGTSLNAPLLIGLLWAAAVLGDAVNYAIGYRIGPAIFDRPRSRWFKHEHLEKAHAFYEKYGAKTIVIARFVPIVRTFAPFVAGIARMTYWKFAFYNVAGGLLWVASLVMLGHFFGNLEIVRKNFSLVILAIIVISVLPMVYEIARVKLASRRAAAPPASGDRKQD